MSEKIRKSGKLRYGVPAVIFVAATFIGSPEAYLLATGLVFVLAVSLKLKFVNLLILAIPFDFSISDPLPFSATISLGIFFLPGTLFQFRGELAEIWHEKHSSLKVLVAWISLVLAVSGLSLIGNAPSLSDYFSQILKLVISVSYAIIAIAVVWSYRLNRDRVVSLLRFWIATAFTVAAVGFAGLAIYFFLGETNNWMFSINRMAATFSNPNSFAFYQFTSILVAQVLAFIERKSFFSWAAIFFAVVAILSGSQTLEIALGVVLLLASVLLAVRNKLVGGWVLSSIIIGAFLAFTVVAGPPTSVASKIFPAEGPETFAAEGPENLEELSYAPDYNRVDGDIRWQIWGEAWELFKQKPLLGIGYGQFILQNSFGKEAHNSHVQLAVGTGIIGYLVFMSLFLFVIVRLGFKSPLNLLFTTYVVGLLVFAMGNSVLHISSAWLIVGSALAIGFQRFK